MFTQMLKNDKGTDAERVVNWVETGVHEALERKYLATMSFGVSSNPEQSAFSSLSTVDVNQQSINCQLKGTCWCDWEADKPPACCCLQPTSWRSSSTGSPTATIP
jgi:hypothetical protein